MLSRIERAELVRHADAWLLWGDREQFTADDLRALFAELDALRREHARLRRELAAARRDAR